MKTMFLSSLFLAATLLASPAPQETPQFVGTWSGNWASKGGSPEAVTVELKADDRRMLTGRFVTPVPMDFSKASFDPKTSRILVEAADQKSEKRYKLDALMKDTELNGTMEVDGVPGTVRLIKWTFFGR